MSDLESKLEQFRKRVEQSIKKTASEQATSSQEKVEEKPKPAEPTAKAEPVSAKIGPSPGQATGSVSQIDRTSVLASPRPASSEPRFSAPTMTTTDTEIPEVEDYMPWLKDDEGATGEPRPLQKPAQPATPPVSHIQKPAPSQQEKTQPSTPSYSAGVSPAETSTPRSYIQPPAVPVRDTIAPFEGTGQPRPLEKKPEPQVEAKVESKPEVQPEIKAEVVQPPVVEAAPAPEPASDAGVERAAKPAASSTYRVTLKRPAASATLESSQEMAEMWGKLPRHIQFLMGPQPKEVAQNSYKQFKENRDELIQRLLDPSLSLEEAARILNVCPTTVRRYTNRGVLPHFRTAGNQRRFRLSDVLAFLERMADGRFEDLEEEVEVGQA